MTILEEILENRKVMLDSFLKNYKVPKIIKHKRNSLIHRIKNCETSPIISEIKFASPSKGKIAPLIRIEEIAKEMELGGVVGISVITEPKFFNGSFEILKKVRSCVSVPILLKDFIFDPKQIHYGNELGADVILLISKILSEEKLQEFYKLAISLNIEVLIEIHDTDDLDKVQVITPEIIGINNRNLDNFAVDFNNSLKLIPEVRKKFPNCLIISESGIYDRKDIEKLENVGADAFLIGTSLMEAPDIELKLKELLG